MLPGTPETLKPDGIIVPLTDVITVLEECSAFIDVIRFEEGEQVDENDLEERINSILR